MKLDLQRIKWSSKECNCFCFPNSNLLILWFKQIDLSKLIENDSPKTSILFFFDIAFRYDYPNKPPMVTCRSHGLFLNPCFYPHCKILFESVACWSKWRVEPFCIDDSLGSDFTPGVFLNERPLNNTPMTVRKCFRIVRQINVVLASKSAQEYWGFVVAHFPEACTRYIKT